MLSPEKQKELRAEVLDTLRKVDAALARIARELEPSVAAVYAEELGDTNVPAEALSVVFVAAQALFIKAAQVVGARNAVAMLEAARALATAIRDPADVAATQAPGRA